MPLGVMQTRLLYIPSRINLYKTPKNESKKL